MLGIVQYNQRYVRFMIKIENSAFRNVEKALFLILNSAMINQLVEP